MRNGDRRQSRYRAPVAPQCSANRRRSMRKASWRKGCGLGSCLSPPHSAVYSPGSQEQDTADSQVGKKHEEPHGRGEGVQKGEVARLAALGGKGQMRAAIPAPSCVLCSCIPQEFRNYSS